MGQRDSACVFVFEILKNWRKRFNSRKFVNLRDSQDETKLFTMCFDGFEGSTRACREFSLSRDDPESEVKLWIHGRTRIGPVLQVKTTCYLDIQETVQNHGLSFPEAHTATWRSYVSMFQITIRGATSTNNSIF